MSVPVADTFDTGAPVRAVAPEAPAATEVAALEASRVPLPTFAARAVATQPEVADETVGALVAAIEQEERGTGTVASGQLAFAVPTPTNRPNFDAVLKGAAKPEPRGEAVAALGALAEGQGMKVAAVVPKARPQAVAADVKPVLKNASFAERPAQGRKTPAAAPVPALALSSGDAGIEAEILSAKGGRVTRQAKRDIEGSGVAQNQDAITSRIAFATLVSAPKASPSQSASHPSGDLGAALRAKGVTLTEVRFDD